MENGRIAFVVDAIIGALRSFTPSTLHKASAQEVFDHVATHLLAQGRKSLGRITQPSGGTHSKCLYRGDDGLKCAAGCLMDDEEAKAIDEGKDWEMLLCEKAVPDAHFSLIKDLQHVHDNFPPKAWLERLKLTAINFKLAPDVVLV